MCYDVQRENGNCQKENKNLSRKKWIKQMLHAQNVMNYSNILWCNTDTFLNISNEPAVSERQVHCKLQLFLP